MHWMSRADTAVSFCVGDLLPSSPVLGANSLSALLWNLGTVWLPRIVRSAQVVPQQAGRLAPGRVLRPASC